MHAEVSVPDQQHKISRPEYLYVSTPENHSEFLHSFILVSRTQGFPNRLFGFRLIIFL